MNPSIHALDGIKLNKRNLDATFNEFQENIKYVSQNI